MAYATADMIREYALRIDNDAGSGFSDTQLVDYADGEDALTINPILRKQYDLSEVAGSEFVKRLSAKCGAKAAMEALYGSNPQDKAKLSPDIQKLDDDINRTLSRLRTGEVRIV